jgi:hypothetical protein
LVIIEAGLGGVAEEHVIVAQLVASFARVLRYNRTGYGRSSLGTYQGPLSASHRAKELSLLLKIIELPPPYILVGQSFGGVFIRTFLEQRGKDDIVGMVFVDCLPHFQGGETLKEFKIFPTLSGGESEEASLRAIGLAQNVVLTPQQSEARKVAAQAAEQSNAEEKEFLASDESVIAVNEAEGALFTKDANGLITDIKFTKQPLGHGRLSVILGDFRRDLEAVLNYGKYHGYGDAELYRKTEELLELAKRTNWNFQKAMTALTAGDSKIRVADGESPLTRTLSLHCLRSWRVLSLSRCAEAFVCLRRLLTLLPFCLQARVGRITCTLPDRISWQKRCGGSWKDPGI